MSVFFASFAGAMLGVVVAAVLCCVLHARACQNCGCQCDCGCACCVNGCCDLGGCCIDCKCAVKCCK